jgi:hypothetical protein
VPSTPRAVIHSADFRAGTALDDESMRHSQQQKLGKPCSFF